MGMEVKVIDENDVFFARGLIISTNPDWVCNGIPLRHERVGITITEFGPATTQDHLMYRDCVLTWPVEKLVFADGQTLAEHWLQRGQDPMDV